MTHTQQSLPYDYSALDVAIDPQTMEIHFTKHHAGYVTKLNAALEEHKDFSSLTLDQLLANEKAMSIPALRSNGGGHANHWLFWEIMSPNGGGEPTGELANAITQAFGG